jgi:signal peptidase I
MLYDRASLVCLISIAICFYYMIFLPSSEDDKEINYIAKYTIFFTLITSSMFSFNIVSSGSMIPNYNIFQPVASNYLFHGFYLPILEKQILHFEDPYRGEVAIIKQETKIYGEKLLKRIIGVGGDTISIKDDVLFINGIRCTAKEYYDVSTFEGKKVYLYKEILPDTGKEYTVQYNKILPLYPSNSPKTTLFFKVRQDHVFYAGDNRSFSLDSRVNGTIHKSYVLGRAEFQ